MGRHVNALMVRQWLPDWEDVEFSTENFRRRPPGHFYLMSLDAAMLRSLVGIYRRTAQEGTARSRDLGIQRAHDAERSKEIHEFVRYGFPWSSLSERKRKSSEFRDLIKPGWLPTAVVVNILTREDERDGQTVHPSDVIDVEPDDGGTATVKIPDLDNSWRAKGLPPIEVIDGQHRLWAFDESLAGYEIPVVAFHGLDRSWQAYLFYTINIKPKRINTSLAFDLYPLLRLEDWLERFEGHSIYRESRAQELTEALWSHPQSPWFHRINMLGERGKKSVTQASWIRSLLATIVKSWEGPRVQIGGLFGAPVGEHELVLPWTRAQQAAFLIHAWRSLKSAVDDLDPDWARALREGSDATDAAFEGSATMMNNDVGVRGFLYMVNDLCFVEADRLRLGDWEVGDGQGTATSEAAVSAALTSFRPTIAGKFVAKVASQLATYDWRSSKAFALSEEERRAKARFRGGTGYRELRADLLRHLVASSSRGVADAAQVVLETLGYDSDGT